MTSSPPDLGVPPLYVGWGKTADQRGVCVFGYGSWAHAGVVSWHHDEGGGLGGGLTSWGGVLMPGVGGGGV